MTARYSDTHFRRGTLMFLRHKKKLTACSSNRGPLSPLKATIAELRQVHSVRWLFFLFVYSRWLFTARIAVAGVTIARIAVASVTRAVALTGDVPLGLCNGAWFLVL
jgi:hypothetical protein